MPSRSFHITYSFLLRIVHSMSNPFHAKPLTNLVLPAVQHSTHNKRLYKHSSRLGIPPLFHPRIQHPLAAALNLPLRAPLHPLHLVRQALNPLILPPSRSHRHVSTSHLLQYCVHFCVGGGV